MNFAFLLSVCLPFSAITFLWLLPSSLRAIASRSYKNAGTLGWFMMVMTIWLSIAGIWSYSPHLELSFLATLLCLPLGWLVTTGQAPQSLSRLKRLWLPILLAGLVIGGALQGPNTYTGKPQALFNDPNAFAAFINLLMLPLLAHWLARDPDTGHPANRIAALGLIAGALFVHFLISSRGASLALLLVIPLLFWKSRQSNRYLRKWGILLILSLLAYTTAQVVTQEPDVLNRLNETLTQGDVPRVQLLLATKDMIQDQPWIGTGLGSFRLLYPSYRLAAENGTAGGWVHNDFLQLWLEAGLPMLLIMLCLCAWLAQRIWQVLRDPTPLGLEQLGYLIAIATALMHATVNFLLYFAPVALLIGTYFALASKQIGISTHSTQSLNFGRTKNRAPLLAAGGYALISGTLFTSLVGYELLIVNAPIIEKNLLKNRYVLPKQEINSWLAVLSPFNASPQHNLGMSLARAAYVSTNREEVFNSALMFLQSAQKLVPCYQPYVSDALQIMMPLKLSHAQTAVGWLMVDQSLDCNPNHGLTYWYAGQLAEKDAKAASGWWLQGLQSSRYMPERMILVAAILASENPVNAVELTELSRRMSDRLRLYEAVPGTKLDSQFWNDAFRILASRGGLRYLGPRKSPEATILR